LRKDSQERTHIRHAYRWKQLGPPPEIQLTPGPVSAITPALQYPKGKGSSSRLNTASMVGMSPSLLILSRTCLNLVRLLPRFLKEVGLSELHQHALGPQ
jgi:hypothetical protein